MRPRLAALLLFATALPSHAFEPPAAPEGRVSDFAGALDGAARARLEAQLEAYAAGSTHQIAVALFRSLEGASIEETSIRLAERWKIGSRRDDGVLVTLFLDDRQLRIEVGYGLESRLTDARCAQIIRQVMVPELKAGRLEVALRDGLALIDTAVTGRAHPIGEVAPSAPAEAEGPLDRLPSLWMVVPLVLFLLLFPLFRRRLFGGWIGRGGGNTRSGGGGGFSGGGGSFGGGGSSGHW